MTNKEKKTAIETKLFPYIGMACPACKEYHDFVANGNESVKLFQEVFCQEVIGEYAQIAFRLVPIPRGIEKRGEAFFYILDNLVPAHSYECKMRLQAMWEYHPGRMKFIEEMVALKNNMGKKVKVIGGRLS